MNRPDLDDFLLRADESSEIFADVSFDIIRKGEKIEGPFPERVTLSTRNLRTLIRATFKAGATFAFAEIIDKTRGR